MRVDADLSFSVDVPDGTSRPARCEGRVRATGADVTVELDPMPSLGGSSTRPLVRPFADQLARQGLTLHVVGPAGPLIRLGAGAKAPLWQRPFTGGQRVELVSVRTLLRSLGGPKVFEVALPPAAVLPAVSRRQRQPWRRVLVAVRQVGRRITGRRR